MEKIKVGERVATVFEATRTEIVTLGYGTYEGVYDIEGDAGPGSAAEYTALLRDCLPQFDVPAARCARIRLDDGRVAWGVDALWMRLDDYREFVGPRTERTIALDAARAESRASVGKPSALPSVPNSMRFTDKLTSMLSTCLPTSPRVHGDVVVLVSGGETSVSALAADNALVEGKVGEKTITVAAVYYRQLLDAVRKVCDDDSDVVQELLGMSRYGSLTGDRGCALFIATPTGHLLFNHLTPAEEILERYLTAIEDIAVRAASLHAEVVRDFATNTDAAVVMFARVGAPTLDVTTPGYALAPMRSGTVTVTVNAIPVSLQVTALAMPREIAARTLKQMPDDYAYRLLTRPETARSGALIQHVDDAIFVHPLALKDGRPVCRECGPIALPN